MRKVLFFRLTALIVLCVILNNLCGCRSENGADEDFSGKAIAVCENTAAVSAANEYTVRGAVPVGYEELSDCFNALDAGIVDYVLADEISSAEFLRSNKRFEIKATPDSVTCFYALFHSDGKLSEDFNTALEYLKSDGTLAKIKAAALEGTMYEGETGGENGELVMGIDVSYPPFSYYKSNGEPAGIDIDTAKAVCTELGYELKTVTADFDECYAKLCADEIDFIMSANVFAPERTDITYSKPYFELGYVLVGEN